MKDGKLNLHKLNGVRIAVPVAKMSLADLEYVEGVTGISLDEDKPLSDLKKRATASASRESRKAPAAKVGASVGASIEPKKPDYDWFQFFLTCEVQPGLCERYAQAFARESMDESVLPDVDASVLRSLGFREGDIIKVTRYLDSKYGRGKKGGAGEEEGGGGLFSGPGGALRNNTRKGRPAPPVETSNVVDAKAFSQQTGSAAAEAKASSPTAAAPPAAAKSASKPASGFDDDAWDVKPSKTPEPAPQQAPAPPAPAPAPAPTPAAAPAPLVGSMQDLSLLSQPLTPEKVQPPVPPPTLNLAPAPAPVPAPAQLPQPTGASPGFFSGMQPLAINGPQQPLQQNFAQQLPQNIARQRPMAPQYAQGQGGLMPPPPPSRPLSAPQSAQPSAFAPPPLHPQMTGYAQVAPPGQSLNDITQARLQQQYAQALQQQQQQQQQPMMPMMTGMPQPQQQQQIPMMTGMPQMPQPMQVQPTGFMYPQQQQPQQQQPFIAQPTGMGMGMGMGMMGGMPPQQQQQQQPLPMQMQPTGFGGVGMSGGGGGGLQLPMQPLVPQKTGPPPPVRFGVTEGQKKIVPQATGRRANLAAASEFSFLFAFPLSLSLFLSLLFCLGG